MSVPLHHNGCDTLLLGFDFDLRRRGFAGNACQIILTLSKTIDPIRLEQRVAELIRQNPILHSRPARGLNLKPFWKPTRATPRVRVHAENSISPENFFNEPLDFRRGELIRFDLIGRTLIFTWSHALMDAKSAEYFLALAGDEQLTAPEPGTDWYEQRARTAKNFRARVRQGWRALERLDQFKKALPISLATQRPPTAPMMTYKIFALSADETAHVGENSRRLCGFLGDTNFCLAATLMELHRLHERTGCDTASYVVPIPVGLRPKGTRAPLFSNQLTMMLHQFFPNQLATTAQAAAAIKTQRADCVRLGDIDSSITLAHLFRALPLRPYMRLIKQALHGEICSLFFGDTSSVDPALQHFLDAGIETFVHVPAVTVPPGVGVVFYRFRQQLQFTIVHAVGTLTAEEADEFGRRLRERLLNP